MPVEAEAGELYREFYTVRLTPGRSYPILYLDAESMLLGSSDEYPISFIVWMDEPGDWSRFQFSGEPLPWNGTVSVWVPLNPVKD
jgi:hypothetical protein